LSTVGSYRLTGLLGEGGMGAVYRAEHTLLGRPAAIKLLLPALSRNQEIVNRFFNEARAATAIRHPGIVEIYDFGYVEDGSAYIAMELLDGEALSARLSARRVLAPAEALGVIRQITGALGAAHTRGIVHRDLKPDNVFLVLDPEVPTGERIKLLDFGIAKLSVEPGQSQTRTGALMGTPTYMAPEQCRGVVVDLRADLYSLGCILFEMLCGRVPFVGEGVGDVLAAHIHAPVPSTRSINPQVPPEVDALVMQLLAKDPAHRPQSAEQVVAAIDGLLGRPRAASQPAIAAPYAQAYSPPSVPPPTTLGGAAGAYPMPTAVTAPRSRTGLWLGLAGVAIAGAAIAAVVLTRGGGDEPSEEAPVAAAKPAPEPPAPAPKPDPKPDPKPEPPEPAKPASVKLVIDTTPQGASVLQGTEPLGVTPLTLERAAVSGTLHLTVRLAGYQDVTMDVPGDLSLDRLVSLSKLEPVVKKKPRRPGKKPAAGGEESDRNGGVNPFD